MYHNANLVLCQKGQQWKHLLQEIDGEVQRKKTRKERDLHIAFVDVETTSDRTLKRSTHGCCRK